MKKIIVLLCLTVGISIMAYVHNVKQTSLAMENVEALSDSPEVERLVSDKSESYVEIYKLVPDEYDQDGKIISWRDELDYIEHITECSVTEGILRCKPGKDIHTEGAGWNFCPGTIGN